MSTTWTQIGTRSAKAVCTTGSESAPSAPASASGTITIATAVAGNTVTIAGKTFTALANGSTAAAYQWAVGTGGTADADSATALANAINLQALEVHVTATAASNVVTITCDLVGAAGNAITLTKVGTPITVSGATLSGGVGYVGLNLRDVGGYIVTVEAVSGQTVAGGILAAYVLNEFSGLWCRAPDLDLTPGAALRAYAFAGSEVVCGRGWVAYVPSGVTVSSGNATVYIIGAMTNCYPAQGRAV